MGRKLTELQYEQLNEANLRKWYLEERLTQAQIGDRIGVKKPTVQKYLRTHNIFLRNLSSREELTRLYIDEVRTLDEIASILGVARETATGWLKAYRISRSDTYRTDAITDELLIQLRITEEISYKNMAKILHVSAKNVKALLEARGISRDPLKGVMARRTQERAVVEICKTEVITQKEIARRLGLHLHTVINIMSKRNIGTLCERRHDAIRKRFEEGASVTELSTEFNLARSTIREGPLKDIQLKKELDPSARKNADRICFICGRTYRVPKLSQHVCSRECHYKRKFVLYVPQPLWIRQMWRGGKDYAEIAGIVGMSKKRVRAIITDRQVARLQEIKAIEALRRHNSPKWLSGLAQLEQRRAIKLLESENLLEPLRREGIIP